MKNLKPQDLFENYFNFSQDLICIAGFDGYFKFLNPAWVELLGFTEKELLSKPFLHFIHHDDHNKNDNEVAGLLKGEITQNFEYRYICKDGSIKHIHWTATPIVDQKVMFCIGRDITAHKEVERALQESETRFRNTFENANIGFCIVSPEGRVQKVNDEMCDILGYSREEFETMKVTDFTHPEDKKISMKTIEQAISSQNEKNKIEKKYIHKKGHIVWASLSTSLVRDKDEKPLYFISHILDITETKKADAALKVKNLVFDASIAANSIADRDGIIVQANKEFLNIWGYSNLDEVIGKPISHFIADEKDAQRIIGAIDIEGKWEGTYYAKREDGSIFFAQGLATKLFDQNEELIGYQSSVLDISEKKNAEEEMQKLAAVVKFSSELVNLSTLDGRMIFLNESGSKMLGIDSHEVENVNIMEVIPEHLKELVEKKLLPTLMKGGVWTGDLQYLNLKTKKLTDVQATTFSIQDPDTGEIQFFANVSIDISKRKKAEMEIVKLKKGLEKQVEEKTRELLEKNRDLQRFNDAMVDRELRMSELFDENKKLKEELKKG